MAFNTKSGVLANATPFVVNVFYESPTEKAKTVYLTSAAGGRLIEFSVDGGVNYFTPTVTQSSVAQQIVSSVYRISHVRFTGVANDVWGIL